MPLARGTCSSVHTCAGSLDSIGRLTPGCDGGGCCRGVFDAIERGVRCDRGWVQKGKVFRQLLISVAALYGGGSVVD